MTYREWKITQRRAHAQVSYAIRVGKLPNLLTTETICVDCGRFRATQYDHRDYSQPMKVDAVCVTCNFDRGSALDYPGVPEGDERYWQIPASEAERKEGK